MEHWRQRLNSARDRGERVVVWGAGSKGTTFLNTVSGPVEYVVDVNPRKTDMFVAGTGQRIVQPRFLVDYRPDLVIVMNPTYRDEIAGTLTDLDLAPDLLVA